MAQRNLRNLLVPAPGDPILTSLSQTLAEAGVYVPVASASGPPQHQGPLVHVLASTETWMSGLVGSR